MKKRIFKVVVHDEDCNDHLIKEVLGKYEIYDVDVTLESEEVAQTKICPECGTKTPIGRSRRCPIGMCSIAAAEWKVIRKEQGW